MFHLLSQLYSFSVDSLYNNLYNDIDGVRVIRPETSLVAPPASPPKFPNRRYLLPCLIYVAYLIDILYLWLWSDFKWTFTGNRTVDGSIGRKFLPSNVAPQADVFWTEVVLMVLAVATQFLLHDMAPFEGKFRMKALVYEDGSLREMRQNGQVLPKHEAESIFKLHRQARKLSNLIAGIVFLFAYPFNNFNVYLNWSGVAADVKACLWICLSLPYITLNLYVALCCFTFNCRYLRIPQRAQMDRLQGLIETSNRALRVRGRGRRPVKPSPHLGSSIRLGILSWSSLSHFTLLNGHLNDLGLLIGGFSRFWSRYLSVYFAGLIFLVTYIAFLLIKFDATQNNLLALAFLGYFGTILSALLLWITLECSVLVVNNKETLKLQRAFTVRASRIKKIPLFAAIKFDHIEADSKSIGRIGFRLLDSVQINSKTFELLFFYISSLFMRIVQHEF